MEEKRKKVYNISWVFPQLTTENTTIDFLGDLKMADKLLSLLSRHLEENIPENEQTRWLLNAALTGVYYRVQLEILGSVE